MKLVKIFRELGQLGGIGDFPSADSSLPSASRPYCECITVDKRKIKDFPKLPSATSDMRGTLYEIARR